MRCIQIGLTVQDLELLDVGMVYDIMIEKVNDSDESEGDDNVVIATQSDFNNF